jgi:predicted Mrr-cat superfamily restriction endonuclease
MFDFIGLALAVFKLLNWILGQVSREQMKNDVRNELIAEQGVIALERTERGKKIMEKVDAMSDDDVDAEFARLARVRGKASGGS